MAEWVLFPIWEEALGWLNPVAQVPFFFAFEWLARILRLNSAVQSATKLVSPFGMPLRVDTRDAAAVRRCVAQDYWVMFPAGDQQFVNRAFDWASDCFEGRLPEYQAIDARYHDFEHTLQGTLCFSTILHRRAEALTEPILPEDTFQLGLLAILLHDTGYLKTREDVEGTGAKYTLTHVNRSCDFAERLLLSKGYTVRQVQGVQSMIRCTGVGVSPGALNFQTDEELVAGFALGTADLLGQMAAHDYVDKLPILFEEFRESADFNAGRGGPPIAFNGVEDLMRRTPGFWQHYVLPKIENDFRGLYRFLNLPGGHNDYLEAIEANLEKLNRLLALAA